MMKGLYEAFEARQDRLALVKRAVQLMSLEPDSRILEVGCGRGDASAYLAQQGFAVTAIDIDPIRIVTARETYEDVCFVCADAARLPFDEGSFDLVFCEASFSSVMDKNSAAKEFFRVLKTAGKLIICDYTIKAASETAAFPPSLAGACSLETHHHIFKEAGFQLLKIEEQSTFLAALVFHLCRTYQKNYDELMTFLGAEHAKYGFHTLIYTKE